MSELKHDWTWKDYEMDGKPAISLADYTIRAFGRDDEINEFLNNVSRYSKSSTRMLMKLVAYWGSGKSTFLYNICYIINDRLFFGDELESPEKGIYRHVLAFFQEKPEKRTKLLDRSYENGLAVTWDLNRPKDEAVELRIELFQKSLRKLAFVFLRKSIHEIKKKGLVDAAVGGAVSRKELFDQIVSLDSLKTSEFMKRIDELQQKNDQTYSEAGELMRYYARTLMTSMEMKKGNLRVSEETFEQQFPKLLFPLNSNDFLAARKALFDTPERNLRVFLAFEKLLRATNTFVLIVFDEVEDWNQVVRDKIDRDLHDLVVDAESYVSLVLVFRTEVLDKIASTSALGTYQTIYERLDSLEMRKMSFDNIKKLTEGILSTARSGKESAFPLSDDFIKALAEKTRRGQETFNPRTFVSALVNILDKSRSWPRTSPALTAEILENDEVIRIIADALKAANQTAEIFQSDRAE